jgi:hypothetical protein
MAADEKDQGSKRTIAEGMSDAGKGAAHKGGTGPGKAPSPPDEVAKGMSKSGSGEATGAGGQASKKR